MGDASSVTHTSDPQLSSVFVTNVTMALFRTLFQQSFCNVMWTNLDLKVVHITHLNRIDARYVDDLKIQTRPHNPYASLERVFQGRCVICGGPGVSDAYYCRECTILEKDRDGCPKIVNLGSAKTDLFYERKKFGFKKTF